MSQIRVRSSSRGSEQKQSSDTGSRPPGRVFGTLEIRGASIGGMTLKRVSPRPPDSVHDDHRVLKETFVAVEESEETIQPHY